MEIKRKPFQGIINIIRFNWHFYLIACLLIIIIFLLLDLLPMQVRNFSFYLALAISFSLILSLIVSFYIYDLSNLYELKWMENVNNNKILSVNAGFDETSSIIKSKFPNCNLSICDFYNPEKHTEISIKRARKKYPPEIETIQISTNKLPFEDETFDAIVAILSVHEIRNKNERTIFLNELNRVLKTDGQILVTEHLRDLNNFLAFNIGFLHFHSKSSWRENFKEANLQVTGETKTTPFITTFKLVKNGNTF